MKAVINGRSIRLPRKRAEESLIDFLREDLDLTGAKIGCRVGICGACTILIDGRARRACKMKIGEIADREVLTIEGMAAADGSLHPLQQSFLDHGAIQCGYCTPGMVLTAHAFLLKHPNPTRAQIRRAISANLCRCTGYQQICDAIEAAASHYR